ncbi:MAG: Panacea domain-containing protein [Rhodospirillaceae bacterium]|nr:Panacea domain-containing protein [Rhodospirillaceae bacterium]
MSTKKYEALVHYIIHECRDHPERLGAIRLNKALWFSDVIAYQTEGSSITGETYLKRRLGPAPRHILPMLRDLQKDGAIVIKEPEFIYESREFYSMRSPPSEVLSEYERRLARAVLDGLLGRTANAVSEMSHDIIWDAADDDEEIPVFATLVSQPGRVTPDMIEWAREAAPDVEMA